MDAFSDFEKTVVKQQPTTAHKIENRVLVDEYMKKKWDEAKRGKETTAALIAVYEMVLHGLNQGTDFAMGDLVQLVEQCTSLSLTGISRQARGAIGFLKREYEHAKYRRPVSELDEIKRNLGHWTRKLELLRKVEEEAQNGAL